MTALLAFDTSSETMHIGLSIGEAIRCVEAPGGAQASAELLPTILALLGDAGADFADLDAIAFGHGPGAFTGLRTACSVAQGLALGAGKPVVAIDTLMAVAEDARHGAAQAQVWAIMDARMDQIYAAQYRYQDRRWSVLDAPRLTSADELNRALAEVPRLHVAGNALTRFERHLELGQHEAHPHAAPRANALLALAEHHWAHGLLIDACAAQPIYVRDKVAKTLLERRSPQAD